MTHRIPKRGHKMKRVLYKSVYAAVLLIATLQGYEIAVNMQNQGQNSQYSQSQQDENYQLQALIKENEYLTKKIDELEKQASYYRAKSNRLNEMGNRYEYQGDMTSAEMKWEESREYGQMAKRIEKEIDKLELEKIRLEEKLEKSQ